MYVYKKTERELWTVGFYSPDGKFNPESDHDSKEQAANRVALLNGNGNLTVANISSCDICGCHPNVIIHTIYGTFCQEHARYS